MTPQKPWMLLVGLLLVGCTVACTAGCSGEANQAQETGADAQSGNLPTSSSAAGSVLPGANFVAAEDLVGQVGLYIEQFRESAQSEQSYNDSKEQLAKDSNTLIVVALALGLHETDNRYQAAAAALMEAAGQLAAAEDYAAAKAAVAAIEAAADSSAEDLSSLEWGKVASLKGLLGAVRSINEPLKENLGGSEFESTADENARYSAVLAVIAQGSMAHGDETIKPEEIEQWQAQCIQMRDAAAALNAAIHASDQAAAEAAMGNLGESCRNCHRVFKPRRGPGGGRGRFRGPGR